MRGLETRVLLAQARITVLLDAAAGRAMLADVAARAEGDGGVDASHGIEVAPVMFDGEALLLSHWTIGQQRCHVERNAQASAGKTTAMGNSDGNFDAAAWRAECMRLVEMANTACGLCFELFEARLSMAVEHAVAGMPAPQREQALAIAVEYGYATAQQREDDAEGCGTCCHGIAWGCCPAGCDLNDD